MADLWFERDLGPVFRRGGMLYASRPDGSWAVQRQELSVPGVPDDLAQQARELLGDYGGLVGGTADQLDTEGIPLSPSLREWGAAQDRPAAELGGWEPTLITIDDAMHLALRRDFEVVRTYATTLGGEHVIVVSPASEESVRLVHCEYLDVPRLGWDQGTP